MTSIVTLTLQWGPITRPSIITNASSRYNVSYDEEDIERDESEENKSRPVVHVYDFGWRGQINGLNQADREQFLKLLPISGVGRPSEVPDAGAGLSSKLVMDHLHNCGEVSREELPMDFVYEYLKILVQLNYRVVASHSQTVNSNEHCSSAAVWTLQKEDKSQLAATLSGLI